MRIHRRTGAALLALSALLGTGTRAEETEPPFSALLMQRGIGEGVETLALGAIWTLPWSAADGRLAVYGELSLNHWESRPRTPGDTGSLLQLGLKPVLRYVAASSDTWAVFAELGIGLTVTSKVYRKGPDRRFSSPFNFGDHVAIGWRFGERLENEISLRAEHFSNGNIKLPNPGENFRELRFVRWFE